MAIGGGLQRTKDGRLYWSGGRHYTPPKDNEALLTWWAGELRPGCNAEVHDTWTSGPCGNTPKHDPDAQGRPTKCGTHCEAAVAKRKAKADARYAAQKAKWARQREQDALRREMLNVILRIAAGHNDPRGLASDWVERAEAAGMGVTLTPDPESP